MTQNNLGGAYCQLPTGDRDENLAKAITCGEAALSVYTERDFPMDWAMAQNNLGAACALGHRGENLAKAIACCEAALRVYTERDFPMDWAMTQQNLGLALADRSEEEDRPRAIACFLAAERGYLAVGEAQRAERVRQLAAELHLAPDL